MSGLLLPLLAEGDAIETPNLQLSAIAPELVMLGCAGLLLLVTCFVRGRYERDLAYLIGIAAFVGAADRGLRHLGLRRRRLGRVRQPAPASTSFGNVMRVIVCGTGLITLLASLGWRTASNGRRSTWRCC